MDREDALAPSEAAVLLQRIAGTDEFVAFGPAEQLDLLGVESEKLDRAFIDAGRHAAATLPHFQGALEQLTGRVLRLTPEGLAKLSAGESMKPTVITGVVRDAATSKITGQLTFADPMSVATVASTLPALAGSIALQLSLRQIEQALDVVKKDLGYLIRHEHLEIEASSEANLEILYQVYSTARRDGGVADDEWDRLSNIEQSVRKLHKESGKHLASLRHTLRREGGSVADRVSSLTRSLDDEHALLWIRAHVHAELALARWDSLYLVRRVQQRPEELQELTRSLRAAVEERHRALGELAASIESYLADAGTVANWSDKIRFISRAKLRGLLLELDELLRAFSDALGALPRIEAGAATDRQAALPDPKRWDELIVNVRRALPERAEAVGRVVAERIPARLRRQRGKADKPKGDAGPKGEGGT